MTLHVRELQGSNDHKFCLWKMVVFISQGILWHFHEKWLEIKNSLKVKLKRTIAQYKLQVGVAKTLEESMLSEITSTYFLLNLDEETKGNHHRVLPVLVSYFTQGKNRSCFFTSWFESGSNNWKYIKEKSTPWKNLVATLMGSCNVMQGSKNGLKKQIKEIKKSCIK